MAKRKKPTSGAAVTIGQTTDKMSEREKLHYACFKGRVAYYQMTGIDLPIEAFEAYKDNDGDYVVRLKGGDKND